MLSRSSSLRGAFLFTFKPIRLGPIHLLRCSWWGHLTDEEELGYAIIVKCVLKMALAEQEYSNSSKCEIRREKTEE